MNISGTSMIKGILNKEFNFYLECCHAELKSYPGATAKELKHNIQFPMQIVTPGKIKKSLQRKKLRRKLLVLAQLEK